MSLIASRDNPRVRRWRALARDGRLRRRQGKAMLEGDHLIAACLEAGKNIETLLVAKSAEDRFQALVRRVGRCTVLADAAFKSVVETEAPAGIAAEIAIPRPAAALDKAASCVFLDAIQDAGNVGTILRSAAAFGIHYAVLGPGCADAWSPKVLRAGMGAHFALRVMEDADLAGKMGEFAGQVASTVPRGGLALSEADLTGRIGWLFGSEGQGVNAALAARADLQLSIPMPGAAESLNVAAAAAICFYAWSQRQKGSACSG